MRIQSIVIKNYRQYKDLALNFVDNGKHDLHIIIGSNGVGKTNLLNATVWCLYGDEPHLGDKSRALPRISLSALDEAREKGMGNCDVIVSITASDGGGIFKFERVQSFNVSNAFERKSKFSVLVTDEGGNHNYYEDDKAKECINQYMPERIREYFFFDGERLDRYFITEQGSKIKDSIHTISQVQLLSTMREHLENVINEKQKEAGKKSPGIANLYNEREEITKQITKLTEDISDLNTQVNTSKLAISKAQEILHGQEDSLEFDKKYTILTSKKEYLEGELKSNKLDILKFIRDYQILLSFYPHIKRTYDIIKEKDSAGMLPPNIDKNFLKQMLDEHKCLVCNRDLFDKEESEVQQLIDRLKVSSELSNLLMSMKSDLEMKIDEAKRYKEKKGKLLDQRRRIEKEIQEVNRDINEIDLKLKSYSNKEKIANAHKERTMHEGLIETNNKKIGAYEHQLKQQNQKLNDLNEKLDKALSQQKECELLKKLIHFAKDANSVIEEVEHELMTEVRNNMQRKTMEYFDRLIWKKNTYANIELDEEYKLDLIHKYGYRCVGSCSAAERALLALSFTLALHGESGFDALLFIDTPVSRVSDTNRENSAVVLGEVSKHKQIIMTFAPSEYSSEIQRVLEPIASTLVKLYTEDERSTQLEWEVI